MASFRFLHCADLHIDSPLRGLEADPDAPAGRIRRATRDAFIALVTHAIDEKVDFVLAAGDLYDGEWEDWRTGQFLVGEVGRLSRAGIPFVAISGNHDAQSVLTRQLNLPQPARLLATDRPETWPVPGLPGVFVVGQGYATRAVMEDLSRYYTVPPGAEFCIGLIHTNADARPGHDNYAPCSSERLRDAGFHYWALGHIHTPAILCEDPWIVYPGNLQGRHVNEHGPRGALLVTVTDNRIVTPPRFVPFDTVRWARIDVDVSGAENEDAVLTLGRRALAAALQTADRRLLAARITLLGESSAYAAIARDAAAIHAKLEAEALGLASRDDIWIEGVSIQVRPPATGHPLPAHVLAGIEAPDLPRLKEATLKFVRDMLDRLPRSRHAAGVDDVLGAEHPVVRLVRDGAIPPDLLERARTRLRAQLDGG